MVIRIWMRFDVLCSGDTYAPDPLTEDERSRLSGAGQRLESEAPAHVTAECPDWLWPYFTDLFADQAETEVSALSEQAPVDLRVNTVKGDRAAARAALETEGLVVREHTVITHRVAPDGTHHPRQ